MLFHAAVDHLLVVVEVCPDRVAAQLRPDEVKDKVEGVREGCHVARAQMVDVGAPLREALVVDVQAGEALGGGQSLVPRGCINQPQVEWAVAALHQLDAPIHRAERLSHLLGYLEDILGEVLDELPLVEIKTGEFKSRTVLGRRVLIGAVGFPQGSTARAVVERQREVRHGLGCVGGLVHPGHLVSRRDGDGLVSLGQVPCVLDWELHCLVGGPVERLQPVLLWVVVRELERTAVIERELEVCGALGRLGCLRLLPDLSGPRVLTFIGIAGPSVLALYRRRRCLLHARPLRRE